ncbi:hypothetical protein ACJ2A9_21425 [Anaerobacillus sp. MEB173]|uniref:hypothetical protein n=1 Tax=Anaerobacillus sp. MEB173 TaxID=3383345 RepID=UPI003F93A942
MRLKDRLPEEEQDVYVLMETPEYKHYKLNYGWLPGTKLKRISRWLSGNGCGVKQAYFVPVDDSTYEHTAWEDHVLPLVGLFSE